MKIYRNADGMIIATERTINKSTKSVVVNVVIKVFFIGSVIGFAYCIKSLGI